MSSTEMNQPKAAPVKATWICLVIAWVLFLVPIPGAGMVVGWPLNLVAFILAIVVMARGRTVPGLIPLISSLVVSPIVYFIGLAIFAAVIGGSGYQDYSTRAQNAASEQHDAAATVEPAAEVEAVEDQAGGGYVFDASKYDGLHRNIHDVSHQLYAEPMRLVVTVNGSGWDEAAIFHDFVGDTLKILKEMEKKKVLPPGHDFSFILRVEDTRGEWRNSLHLEVPGQTAAAAIASSRQRAAQELLGTATVIFNGPIGREVVTDFCNRSLYQGPSGVMDTPAFCRRALAR